MNRILVVSVYIYYSFIINFVSGDNNITECYNDDGGIWGPVLEEWSITNHREKRIMQFTPSYQNAYLNVERSDKIDKKESKITPGKIVNTNVQNPNRKQSEKQVTETDLYLLNAIEKLVYRVDFMEKRLRRVEEMLHYVMAGSRIDQESCPHNFTRAGVNCYLFASNAGRELDWKAASKYCHKFGAYLVEMESIEENQHIISYIQSNTFLRGKDFWTGGLNPGLLWIWSNSARPVSAQNKDKKQVLQVLGDGRCLRLAYDPALRNYIYKGTDCSIRYNYICEITEKTSSNEITRIGRMKQIFNEF